MPPAEQGESAADRTFDAEKEVADTPRIGRCSLERSCHRLRTRRCEARRHEKRSFERPPLWRRPRAAIVSEWLLRARKVRRPAAALTAHTHDTPHTERAAHRTQVMTNCPAQCPTITTRAPPGKVNPRRRQLVLGVPSSPRPSSHAKAQNASHTIPATRDHPLDPGTDHTENFHRLHIISKCPEYYKHARRRAAQCAQRPATPTLSPATTSAARHHHGARARSPQLPPP